jgi:hypothetical protein
MTWEVVKYHQMLTKCIEIESVQFLPQASYLGELAHADDTQQLL